MSTVVEKPATVVTDEKMRCFVCDVAVSGKYYILATCRTQATRIRLIEKLGQLVGERYMVVISEDDIICRGCANLMNTLDRLETEMGSVRNVVLRFLEKKYSLDDGELLNNKTTGSYQQSHIATVTGPQKVPVSSENFMSRKRKAALAELENEQENSLTTSNKRTKNDIWMKCDKCHYTTSYNSFMTYHIRQHVKKKPELCDYCGDELKSGACSNHCAIKKSSEAVHCNSVRPAVPNISRLKQPSKRGCPDTEAETVQMIAAEINEFASANRNATETSSVSNDSNQIPGHSEVSPVVNMTMVPVGENRTADLNPNSQMQIANSSEMTIEVCGMPQENSTPTAICVMDMSEQSSAVEPTLLVQNVEDDTNAVYVQVVDVGKGDENVPKQVLTVADDGTVEMVEVMWNEMGAHHVVSGQNLHF